MREELGDAARRKARERALERARSRGGPPPWKAVPSDLQSLDGVKTLLAALNDAYAGAHEIQRLVEDVRVLKARCIRRARLQDGNESTDLGAALNRIGNKGLESELLEVLEDLTMLSADSGD